MQCNNSKNTNKQKILGEKANKELTAIRKKYLSEQGFTTFKKDQRDKVNALFYPENKDNPYMKKLKEEAIFQSKTLFFCP